MTKINYWIQNFKRDKLERSMEAFSRLVKSKSKRLGPFVGHLQDDYSNDVDKYGNQIGELSREESLEHRWNKARTILLKSK